MAANIFKKYTESKTREWEVPEGTESGDYVIHDISGQVGVALTSRGDATRAAGIPGVTGGTVPNGGVGNKETAATVAVDGSFLFNITGADDGETVAGTGTAAGTTVYAGADAQTVALSGDDEIGVIDDGAIVDGVGPILIGAVL